MLALFVLLLASCVHALVPNSNNPGGGVGPGHSDWYIPPISQGRPNAQQPGFGEVDLPLGGGGEEGLPPAWMPPGSGLGEEWNTYNPYQPYSTYQHSPVPSQSHYVPPYHGLQQSNAAVAYALIPPAVYHQDSATQWFPHYTVPQPTINDQQHLSGHFQAQQQPEDTWDNPQPPTHGFHILDSSSVVVADGEAGSSSFVQSNRGKRFGRSRGGLLQDQQQEGDIWEASDVHPQMHGYYVLDSSSVAAEEEGGSSSVQKGKGRSIARPSHETKAERKEIKAGLLAYMAEEGLSKDTHPQELAAMVIQYKILHEGKENTLGQMASKIVRDWGNPEYYSDFYAWMNCYRNHVKNLRKKWKDSAKKKHLSEAERQQYFLDHFRDVYAGHYGTLADAQLEAQEWQVAQAVWADFLKQRIPAHLTNTNLDMPTIATLSHEYKYKGARTKLSHHDSLRYIKKYLRQARGVPFTDIEVLTNLTLPVNKGGRHAHRDDRDLTP